MESYGVVMGSGGLIVADTVSKNLQSDPFSKMLANVVKDSSLLQKNEPVKKLVPPPKRIQLLLLLSQKRCCFLRQKNC